MARVTGIGGVFVKSKGDPKALAAWYAEHLGLKLEPWGGAILRWTDDHADDRGLTVWHTAKPGDGWFPGACMINYRVDDMEALIAQLTASGIVIADGPQTHENGKFAWIFDPEGNKVELWEPKLWDEKSTS